MQSFLNNNVFRLAPEQQQNPKEVLNCFFHAYDLTAAKEYITGCVEIALTTDNNRFDTAIDRANLVRFSHLMEELLEAVSIMQGGK